MIMNLKKSCAAISLLVAAVTVPASAETIAITGGTVHTLGAAGTLENATVLIRDGVIEAVGVNVAVPAGATVVDASGQVVAPGFMHGSSRLGLSEVGAAKSTNAHSSKGSIFGAAFDVQYGLNYRSVVIQDNRRRGITHAVSGPSRADGIFAGNGVLISLTSTPDMVVGKGPMYANIGSGGNRAVAWAKLRLILDDVKEYKRNRSSNRKGKGRDDFVLSALNMDALIPVVDGDQVLVLSVGGEVDIRQAIVLKKDYNLNLVLQGAAEAWLVAKELADADISVLINAQENRPSDFNVVWSSRSNAAKLAAAGVRFAIADAGANHNASNIRQHAGIAVSHGLSWEDAMKALTIAPAQIFGLEGYGTIEPGMAANIAVWDGDPLEVTSNTTHVIVGGVDIPTVSRRTMLRDKYLNK